MESLKRLEKGRRKAAHRSMVSMRGMVKAFDQMRMCEKAIEEIERKKKPDGVWAQLAAIEAGIERLGLVAMKSRAGIERMGREDEVYLRRLPGGDLAQ